MGHCSFSKLCFKSESSSSSSTLSSSSSAVILSRTHSNKVSNRSNSVLADSGQTVTTTNANVDADQQQQACSSQAIGKNRFSLTPSRFSFESDTAQSDYLNESINRKLPVQNYISESSNKIFGVNSATKKLNSTIDQLLPTVRSVIMKNNEENPADIVKLQQIAKDESLWLSIILRLIDKIELSDQLGPSIIAIFLEETPLPSKEQIDSLTDKMTITGKRFSEKIQRNILVILSCLSEKIAGTSLASILTEKTLDFTLNCLNYGNHLEKIKKLSTRDSDELNVLLFALIAIEKFSMSAHNKLVIMRELNTNENALIYLSTWVKHGNPIKHQIGFLAQYLLDNICTPDNYQYSYTRLNTENTNVRLNDDDTSENLKISPDGLEARNDTLSFESVRSTIQVDEGIWYYEVTLLTNGIMQLGFATKSASFLNHQGCGIGDDRYSVGFDGCRNLIWYNANYHTTKQATSWKEGDVIGFLLDIDNQKICFYINGKLINPVHTNIFLKVSKGFFPAASFMSFQHVLFNFGKRPFKYPPQNCQFNIFNDYGKLEEDKKYVLPKRKKLELLRQLQIKENACSLCYENISNVVLNPCSHKNFCEVCIKRLKNCPICRSLIKSYDILIDAVEKPASDT